MSQAGIVTVFVATSAWLVQVVTKSSLELALSLRAGLSWIAVPLVAIVTSAGKDWLISFPYA